MQDLDQKALRPVVSQAVLNKEKEVAEWMQHPEIKALADELIRKHGAKYVLSKLMSQVGFEDTIVENLAVVTLLIRKDCSLTWTNDEDKAPLEVAAFKGRWGFVRLIAKLKSAQMLDRTGHGKTLNYAVEHGQLETVKVLLKANAPDYANAGDRRACDMVIRLGQQNHRHALAIAAWLADAGFNWEHASNPHHYKAPIKEAESYPDILKVIHDSAKRKALWGTLFKLTQQGDFAGIGDFFGPKRNKDISRDTFFANNSLCWAIEHKYTDIAALLLILGFDPNNTNSSGKAPAEIDSKILAAAVELAKDSDNLALVSPIFRAITKVRDGFLSHLKPSRESKIFITALETILEFPEGCRKADEILVALERAIRGFHQQLDSLNIDRETWPYRWMSAPGDGTWKLVEKHFLTPEPPIFREQLVFSGSKKPQSAVELVGEEKEAAPLPLPSAPEGDGMEGCPQQGGLTISRFLGRQGSFSGKVHRQQSAPSNESQPGGVSTGVTKERGSCVLS